MKLLLDENLPERLKEDLPDHQVFTVKELGWISFRNGDLLRLMIAKGFDALITVDRNLKYQQNFTKYPIPVIVLRAKNDQNTLHKLTSQLRKLLKRRLHPGAHELFLHP